MAQWKILRGVHADKNMKLVRARVDTPDDVLGVERRPGDGVFYGGDIVESDLDLGPPKFEKVESPIAVQRPPDGGLESMTVAELKQHAAEEEIDLGDATKRAEILRICQEATPDPIPA